MDKNVMELWTDALRSGKYKQGEGYLRNYDNEFCCLGVLADLLGKPTKKLDGGPMNYPSSISVYHTEHRDDFDSWPLSTCEVNLTASESCKLKLNLGYSFKKSIRLRSTLDMLNDNGFSFKEIADIIERNADML